MTTLESQAGRIPSPREITTEPRFSDKVFRGVVTAGGLSSLVILGLIAIFLGYQGFEILAKEGISFITTSEWVVEVDSFGAITNTTFGLAAMLVGTILCAIIAVVIAVPISVSAAIFLSFYAPNSLKKVLVSVIDLMAAFPSILFGFWGLFVLMPSAEYWAKLINKYLGFIPIFEVEPRIFTRSPFIAGVVLAIMIIPIVTSISREVFSQTPLDRIQAAYALGATRWNVIRTVALPYARGGIVGGSMLGLGRAMGETVAVYTVLNIVYQINWNVLFGAGGNVASLILLKFGEAQPYEIKALMAAGLVLFMLTLLVNFLADQVITRSGTKGR
ncbi:MAG: phosphate ABC transporter permease subunit PstC [Candidatus Nanopelagicaceae bacterium]|nr:phosphate ABC transporter permease subunit PstC [Candidatus Nanopelagicaceae bacterium]